MLHGVLISMALASPESGRLESVESIVAAHQSGLALIHSIDLTLELRSLADGEGDPDGPDQVWRWSRDENRERIRHRHKEPLPTDGLPTNLTDTYIEGSQLRYLGNWDPDHPQPLTPLEQGSLRAFTEPLTRKLPGQRDPGLQLLQTFQIPLGGPRRTLWQVVREEGAELVSAPDAMTNDLYHIRVTKPDLSEPTNRCVLDVFLDPACGFHVRRSVVMLFEKGQPIGGTEREVRTFQDYGNGVFFPAEAVVTAVEPGKAPVPIWSVRVKRCQINEPIDGEAFHFVFPENAVVRHFPPVDNKVKAEIWGPDNKPRQTVAGFESLGQTLEEKGIFHLSPWRIGMIVANLAIIIAIGYWIARRRHSGR